METTKSTLPKTAVAIMGSDNVIELEEVVKLFPCDRKAREKHNLIPFSPELLYNCSEPKNQCILFPGIAFSGGRSLTMHRLHSLSMLNKWDFFLPFPREYESMKAHFLFEKTCEARWYLISKDVLNETSIRQRCSETGYVRENFRAAPAVVYALAWILFKLLRSTQLFPKRLLMTGDRVTDRVRIGHVYLGFKTGKILAREMRILPSAENTFMGYATSVDPGTE